LLRNFIGRVQAIKNLISPIADGVLIEHSQFDVVLSLTVKKGRNSDAKQFDRSS